MQDLLKNKRFWTGAAIAAGIYPPIVPMAAAVVLPVLAVGSVGSLVKRACGWSAKNVGEGAAAAKQRVAQALQERQRRLAAPQREREAQKQKENERRRVDVRARCERFFSAHRPEIEPRFSKEMFDDYVQRHLSDQQEIEVVERRGEELFDLLQQHLNKVEPPTQEETIESIILRHNDARQKILDLDIDEEVRDDMLATLEESLDSLIKKKIREMKL